MLRFRFIEALMQLVVIPGKDLSEKDASEWRRLQQQSEALDSPLFDVDLFRLLAEIRRGVEVGIVKDGGETIAFLPFHRESNHIGYPAAGALADYQGLICRDDCELDARWLVRECQLLALHFTNIVLQPTFEPFAIARSDAPVMDLSGGFNAYRRTRNEMGGRELTEVLRKSRKMERELGPIEFVSHSMDDSIFDLLVQWKGLQLASRHLPDVLATEWIRSFLRRVANYRTPSLQGVLSVLYVQQMPAAITLGVRSKSILHGWLTAFDPRFAKYSPGLQIMIRLAQAAEGMGISRIDMGCGDEPFKQRFQSGAFELGEGVVDLRLLNSTITQGWLKAKAIVSDTPLREPIRRLVRGIRSAGNWLKGSSG